MEDCIFCKIVAGEIPSHKIYESENILAFLDAFPLSTGHSLVIPKKHVETLPDIDDIVLYELITITKKIAKILDCNNYNILQNNGKLAYQAIKHAHFHIIPKTDDEGLKLEWVPKKEPKGLEELANKLRNNIN